ncbi:hypothetical protein EON81_27840 [bacterium]|nr:MAG: hypothetical protein EON81_27840 [bacterium]
MRALLLLGAAAVVVACGKPADPLAGKWDIRDPETAAKGGVTVGTFGEGKFTLERRTQVLGIGQIRVTTSGTYTIETGSATLTNGGSQVDASTIPDPKVRQATVGVAEGMAKASEGKPLRYEMAVQSPDQIVLRDPSRTLTLTRAR